jgi:hypothetical protein
MDSVEYKGTCGRFTLRTPLTVLSQQFQFDLDNAVQLTSTAQKIKLLS